MSDGTWMAATYNIHRCIGSDGRHSPERTASVIERLDADIVGLQEVDVEVTRKGWVDQARVLGTLTGMRSIAGPAAKRPYGRYGNALLTRLPIVDVNRHRVGVPGLEPRVILEAELRRQNANIYVLVTHFGLRWWERSRQMAKLLDLLDERRNDLLIVMGDFNEWRPWSRVFRTLDERLGKSRRRRTFPSRWPIVSLDRIWVWPPHAVRRADVLNGPEARRASDHLPLRVEISTP